VARKDLYTEAENVPILPWPAYSPDMSSFEHVWDALGRLEQQRVPVPANIQQLRIGHNQQLCEGDLHDVNGGHTRYCLVF
jgi:hypothetical protein